MAESYKKIYISVREFINAWEKEIYQLSNLDLFAFLLINELASSIERAYFGRKSPENDVLYLYSEDIGSLCFTVADSLQLFFEKNCFGACNLNCPIELKGKTKKGDWNPASNISQLNIIPSTSYSKEHCLHHDMLNYVVLDSVIDFYNYEMGLVFDEDNEHIIHFADFIVKVILVYIKKQGQVYLIQPNENAGEFFHELLAGDESDWEEGLEAEDMDEEETETWKTGHNAIVPVMEEFHRNCILNGIAESELHLLYNFRNYLCDFLELKSIDEITMEDLGEYLSVVFPNDFIFHSLEETRRANDLLIKLMNHLEYNFSSEIPEKFRELNQLAIPDIIRSIEITQDYNLRNSYIEHLLENTELPNTYAEGFMQVIDGNNHLYNLEDIHLKSGFNHVDLSQLDTSLIRKGDILHIQLNSDGQNWKMTHLEMAYTPYARYYLF